MSNRSLFSDLSASTVNKLLTTVHGSIFFLIISVWLPKSDLGIYAWCLSIATLITTGQTLGTGQPMVRRIAAEAEDAGTVARVALFIRTTMALSLLLVALPIVWPLRGQIPYLEILIVAYLVMSIYMFAQVAIQALQAKQRFWAITLADQSGLVIKLILGAVLVYLGFGVAGLYAALAVSFVITAAFSFSLAAQSVPRIYSPLWNRKELGSLLREGLPLLPLPILYQTLSRADWILLGFYKTDVAVAEYAFAYRIYEIGSLPAAVLGVILLPKLSAWLRGLKFEAFHAEAIPKLVRVIIALSALIPLNVVLAWTPVIDGITDGKYGAVNQMVISALAFCTPLVAGDLIYWSIFIAMVRNKTIMMITVGTCILNVALNLILIPSYGGLGSAVSFFFTVAMSFFGYVVALRNDLKQLRILLTLILVFAIGFAAAFIARQVGGFWLIQCALASAIYIGGILLIDRVPWREALDLVREKMDNASPNGEQHEAS